MRRLWFCVLAAVICNSRAIAAQEPPFHSSADVVPVFATVIDHDGRLVTDLSAQDFEIRDEGRQQSVSFFSNATEPVAAVVVLDSSLAVSVTPAFRQIRNAAEEFVLRLLPGDRARVCAFNDKIQFSPDFTSDRDALARTIQGIDFGNGSRLYDALAASIDALEKVDLRRVILLFTDGHDTASRTKLAAVMDRARASDVTVYAVGLERRHLEEEADDDDDESVNDAPDSRIRKLAVETGGMYMELNTSSDSEVRLTRIAEELHRQYMLAFAPTSLDVRVHRLSVRVRNRRLKVHARRSYVANAVPEPHHQGK